MSLDERIAGLAISGALSLPTEIWTAIGSNISSPKTLSNLTITCRTFRAIFSPFLFEKRVIQLNLWDPEASSRRNDLPPGLEHTKELGIFLNEWHGTGVDYGKENNSKYGRFIARMISRMPKLQSFWWDDQAFEDYSPALILRLKRLIVALSSAPNLKMLYISYSMQFLDDDLDAQNCFPHLRGFSNLTSLELYHIHGKMSRLVKDLAEALSRSPGLKALGLALACDADADGGPEAILIDGNCTFWDSLCLKYGTLGVQPLSLETLKLGYAMLITDTFTNSHNDEETLQDLLFRKEKLKVFHTFNGLVKFESLDNEEEDLDLDWEYMKSCISLRQVAVSRLDKECAKWLNESAKGVTELIITDPNYMDGRTQGFLATLNHQLTLLLAPQLPYYGREDESSSASESESDSSNPETVEAEIEEASAGSSVPENKPEDKSTTVLDLLKDGGLSLKQLAISLDHRNQWTNFISSLKKMKLLTHLYVIARKWRPDTVEPLHESETHKDIAMQRAKLIKFNCPSIQAIRVENWTWQFIAQRDLSKITKDDVYSAFEMIEMDWIEVVQIDALAIDHLGNQSGLPNKRRMPPYDYWNDHGRYSDDGFETDDSDASDLGATTRRGGWYRDDEI